MDIVLPGIIGLCLYYLGNKIFDYHKMGFFRAMIIHSIVSIIYFLSLRLFQ